MNGGTCNPSGGCCCPDGYSGTTCEIKSSEGGSCTSTVIRTQFVGSSRQCTGEYDCVNGTRQCRNLYEVTKLLDNFFFQIYITKVCTLRTYVL